MNTENQIPQDLDQIDEATLKTVKATLRVLSALMINAFDAPLSEGLCEGMEMKDHVQSQYYKKYNGNPMAFYWYLDSDNTEIFLRNLTKAVQASEVEEVIEKKEMREMTPELKELFVALVKSDLDYESISPYMLQNTIQRLASTRPFNLFCIEDWYSIVCLDYLNKSI